MLTSNRHCSYWLLTGVLVCLVLTGCGPRSTADPLVPGGDTSNNAATANQTQTHSGHGAPPVLGQIPALPQDAWVDPAVIATRRAAAVGTMGLLGSQAHSYDVNSAYVDPAEQSCVLKPGAGQLSWAIYAFPNLLPQDSPLLLSVFALGELPPGPCYVAVSDYSHGRWDWTAFSEPQQEFTLPIPQAAGAISPGGTVYVVVAAWNARALAIGHLGLQLDCANPPPDGFTIDDGDGVQAPVHLTWIDPAITYDPDGAGPQQYSYNGILVQRTLDPLGQWDDLMQLAPGTVSFDDPDTLGSQGGTHYYRLMTLITGLPVRPGFVLPGNIVLAINELKAKFIIAPLTANPGTNFGFTGTGSTVAGGTIKNVWWDYEGNGTWDRDTAPKLYVSHVFPTAGRYYPRLKLVMDIGGGATMTDIATGYLAVGDSRGDWSQLGRNSQHTSCSPVRGPKTATVRGSYTAGGAFIGASIAADGSVCAPNTDGNMYYLSPGCTLLEKISLGTGAKSAAAINSNRFVWLNVDLPLFASQLACIWSDMSVHKYAPTIMTGTPVVTPDGLFVVAPAANAVYKALPNKTGSPWYYWTYTFPSGTEAGTPAIDAGGYIYIAVDTALYKLSPDGKLVWKTPDLPKILHDPSVSADGTVYVPMDYHLYAFDNGGNNLWMVDMLDSTQAIGAPAIAADGNIYVSTDRGSVHAFTPGGWEPYTAYSDPGVAFCSPPLIDGNGNLFVLTTSGYVVSLTKKLVLRWSYFLGGAAQSCSLALGNDGTLYVGGTKKLVALQ
jgi:hypothetical protein